MGSLEPFKPYSNGLRLYADSPNFSPSIRDQVLPLCGVMIVEQIGVSSTSQFDLAVCGVSWTDFERCVCVCVWMILRVCVVFLFDVCSDIVLDCSLNGS